MHIFLVFGFLPLRQLYFKYIYIYIFKFWSTRSFSVCGPSEAWETSQRRHLAVTGRDTQCTLLQRALSWWLCGLMFSRPQFPARTYQPRAARMNTRFFFSPFLFFGSLFEACFESVRQGPTSARGIGGGVGGREGRTPVLALAAFVSMNNPPGL